jgi:DNA-binding transcriptional regulator YdaS (Cro superfamily)
MSATSVKLLKAASRIMGGDLELAARLGIDATLLAAYLAGTRPLPDSLLLSTVDVLLAERASRAQVDSASSASA